MCLLFPESTVITQPKLHVPTCTRIFRTAKLASAPSWLDSQQRETNSQSALSQLRLKIATFKHNSRTRSTIAQLRLENHNQCKTITRSTLSERLRLKDRDFQVRKSCTKYTFRRPLTDRNFKTTKVLLVYFRRSGSTAGITLKSCCVVAGRAKTACSCHLPRKGKHARTGMKSALTFDYVFGPPVVLV